MAKTWKCKDGRIILITEMSDQHLLNTIYMLRSRNLHEDNNELADFLSYMPPQGDMALLAWENEFAELMDKPIKRKHKAYDSLAIEAYNRGLL